jgi:hypothetical protein
MCKVALWVGVALWLPGLVGFLSLLTVKLMDIMHAKGPLAWLGVIGLGMSYVVPFASTQERARR